MSSKDDGVDLLQAVAAHARSHPDAPAHTSREDSISYGELVARSDALAAHLWVLLGEGNDPVLVLGHKHTLMTVGFLGSVKAGRAYIPVDNTMPADRLRAIIREARPAAILDVGDRGLVGLEDLDGLDVPVLGSDDLLALPTPGPREVPTPDQWVSDDAPFYIIYTSGSTGAPKGVQISRVSLTSFIGWGLDLLRAEGVHGGPGVTFLNQAPFSFDLSVMDMALALASGSQLFSIDSEHIANLRTCFEALRASEITVWVSTPSFATMCLGDDTFDQELLPDLRVLLFCGETLPHVTASTLRQRFPAATVVNTYGPTESTVAVTSVRVTDEVLATHPVLPVGAVKPGSHLLIVAEDGTVQPEGERGHILIGGDTVSLGYYRRADLTERAFVTIDRGHGPERVYRTGDAGYLREGQLHFLGRLDFQVKLHGYRIELEDIEANLVRIGGIRHAVVVAVDDGGPERTITHLRAFVQLADPSAPRGLAATVALKRKMRDLVPDYMVPKIFSYVDNIPLTANGKADRARLLARTE